MSETVSEVDSAIAGARVRFVNALSAGDVEDACRVYASQARLLPPSGRALRGAHQIRQFWQAGLESGMSGLELEATELIEHDDFAYEIGRYTLRIQSDGSPVVERGHYVQIHARNTDGSWSRAVEIFSPGDRE